MLSDVWGRAIFAPSESLGRSGADQTNHLRRDIFTGYHVRDTSAYRYLLHLCQRTPLNR